MQPCSGTRGALAATGNHPWPDRRNGRRRPAIDLTKPLTVHFTQDGGRQAAGEAGILQPAGLRVNQRGEFHLVHGADACDTEQVAQDAAAGAGLGFRFGTGWRRVTIGLGHGEVPLADGATVTGTKETRRTPTPRLRTRQLRSAPAQCHSGSDRRGNGRFARRGRTQPLLRNRTPPQCAQDFAPVYRAEILIIPPLG